MRRKIWCLLLCFALVGGPGWAQVTDPEVAKGIKQVEDGEYDSAILTLDNAARHLATDRSKTKELSEAYLYLGIAYIGKGHVAAAKEKFREAIAQIKDLSLSPEKFPPKVIDVFEAAKEEARKSPAPAAKAPEKKGGSHTAIYVIGGVAVAGAVAAAAAGGGNSATPVATPKADSRQALGPVTGTLCCSTYPENLRAFDIPVGGSGALDAEVTWQNSDTNIFFTLSLDDDNYTTVATSNRISNAASHLTTQVSPRTSGPGAAYHLYLVLNNNGTTGAIAFTLTVRYP